MSAMDPSDRSLDQLMDDAHKRGINSDPCNCDDCRLERGELKEQTVVHNGRLLLVLSPVLVVCLCVLNAHYHFVDAIWAIVGGMTIASLGVILFVGGPALYHWVVDVKLVETPKHELKKRKTAEAAA
ncbi:hypothetical protein [Candidatus Bathycorpusculum sp.]|uniref:hypothetical protein n=1 Tax=Candidatus Bathycorpusculum sp. TaxID=2994959 RepID=UPI00282637D3|nr:hypothetical protein [Candidatus Termitimicrobium sp.]MCL2685961.1 hypothetical protein [Candidatus Termitimicrobium sp.]